MNNEQHRTIEAKIQDDHEAHLLGELAAKKDYIREATTLKKAQTMLGEYFTAFWQGYAAEDIPCAIFATCTVNDDEHSSIRYLRYPALFVQAVEARFVAMHTMFGIDTFVKRDIRRAVKLLGQQDLSLAKRLYRILVAARKEPKGMQPSDEQNKIFSEREELFRTYYQAWEPSPNYNNRLQMRTAVGALTGKSGENLVRLEGIAYELLKGLGTSPS